MNVRNSIIIATLTSVLAACAGAPQMPVALEAKTFAAPTKIGIYMTTLPKVDTSFPGAGCLLCLAAASVANTSLTNYTRTLPYEDLPTLTTQVAQILKARGASTVIIDKIDLDSLPSNGKSGPNVARKDFSSLKAKLNVDKLLVISIASVGMTRNYSSYFPVGAPHALVSGTSYIVNLDDNTFEWYMPVNVSKGADNNWDEPPKFPGLSNAYFQTLELAKDAITAPLSK